MAYIKFENGFVSKWDETISVGSLITTYNDGYHVLMRIEFREQLPGDRRNPVVEWSDKEAYPYTPVFHYEKVLKGDGTKSKALTGQCDASFCKRVTLGDALAEMDKAREAATNKVLAIKQFL